MAKKPQKKAPAKKQHTFLWEGTNLKGKKIKGEVTSSNPNMARAELRRQKIKVKKIRKQNQSIFGGPRKKKITSKDIAIFSRQLATMMSAGVPLVQAFEIIGESNNNVSMQKLVLSIRNEVEGGTALHQALRKHPTHFDALFCNLVKAGEQAGVLESLLHKIATYKEKTEAIKSKIKKAMYYPAAVFMIAMVITAGIMVFVVPQFESMFSSFGSELPIFTQMVVNTSRFVSTYWWAILGVFFGLGFLFFRLMKRSENFRDAVDRILLKIPVIGNILHKGALARFCRTTATMFAAGVPLVEALESVSGATGSSVYRKAVLAMRDDVSTGQSLQFSMRQQKIFPHMVTQMVAIGEESGALDDMLSKVADFYEEEVDNAVDSLSSLLEPIIIVVLGTLVGGLVIALYLPMFQMGSVMSGG